MDYDEDEEDQIRRKERRNAVSNYCVAVIVRCSS